MTARLVSASVALYRMVSEERIVKFKRGFT